MSWKNKPEISVVIPTFKRPSLLVRCLTSLINQTLNKNLYEIIVVDDGKDIKIKSFLSKFKEQGVSLKIFPTKGGLGPAAARNIGWKKAKGRIIAFTDDDAIPALNWLKNGLREIKNGAKVLTGRIIVPVSPEPSDYEINVKRMEKSEFLTANLFIIKKILKKIHGFDENFTAAFREDSDLQFSLIETKILINYSASIKVFHPVRKESWLISLKEQKKSLFNALLFKKHPKLFRERLQKSPPVSYYGNCLLLIFLPLSSFFGNNYLSGIIYLGWAFLLNIFIFKRLKQSSRSAKGIFEIILTSILIPPFSVFWRIYGALKFRVFFL